MAVSLAAHALLAAVILSRSATIPPPMRPIETALIEIAAPKPKVSAPSTAAPTSAPVRVPNRPAARAPVRALAPKAVSALGTIPIAAAPTADAPTAASGAPSGIAALPSATGIDTAPTAGTNTIAAVADDTDEVLRELHQRLADAAHACYPAVAARLRLSGTTRVHFCVEDGHATDVRIESSSGEAILDRAASECVLARSIVLPTLHRCRVVPIEFKH